jgi:hypothetical protein
VAHDGSEQEYGSVNLAKSCGCVVGWSTETDKKL